MTDAWGARVTGTAEAVGLLDRAVAELAHMRGSPLATADQALLADPTCSLAAALGAYLHLYAGTRSGADEARRRLASAPPSDPRAEAHHTAAATWVAGDLVGAAAALEGLLAIEPLDLLALRVVEDLHFFCGRSDRIEAVAAGVLPAWRGRQGEGLVLAMWAFGLEETGRYDEALAAAHAALEQDRTDVWAAHAVAHVHEMRGQPAAGERFLRATTPEWDASFFAAHQWWHLALFQLALGRLDDAMALYDGPVRGAHHSPETLDLIDASSLLWRLHLLGADPGERPAELAEAWAGREGRSAFDAAHAAMAFALAGRTDLADRLVGALEAVATGTNAAMVRAIGLPLVRAVLAMAAGCHGDAVDALAPARGRAATFGGSHAQRDVVDQTLLAAAVRAGRTEVAGPLLAERRARPGYGAHTEALLAANHPAGSRL